MNNIEFRIIWGLLKHKVRKYFDYTVPHGVKC